jgi:uncharacterized protein YciI
MNHYLLIYYTVEEYVDRRAPFREEHLRLVTEAYKRGDVIMAGALADPVDRAVLVFRSPDKTVIEDFIRNDPYVLHGLITRWEIRPWTVVVGNL